MDTTIVEKIRFILMSNNQKKIKFHLKLNYEETPRMLLINPDLMTRTEFNMSVGEFAHHLMGDHTFMIDWITCGDITYANSHMYHKFPNGKNLGYSMEQAFRDNKLNIDPIDETY